ncbi:MAG TPA: nuclear transport factor 2 family protein [Dokdonella sp.]|nr:nuclear transport factor 2 family protein [Dokdonella sp.]
MNTQHEQTERVVRNHLQSFVEHKGLDAILADYDERAIFIAESKVYRGKPQIREFFEGLMQALPADAAERFSLSSLWVEGTLAYITWSVGGAVPLGTDTFVVDHGKIVSQTSALYFQAS